MNKSLFFLSAFFLSLLSPVLLHGETIVYEGKDPLYLIGESVSVLEDKKNSLTIYDVIQTEKFIRSDKKVPNLGLSSSAFWIKFTVENQRNQDQLTLLISNALLDKAELYAFSSPDEFTVQTAGDRLLYSERLHDHQQILFDMVVPAGNTRTFFLKVYSTEPALIPLSIGTYDEMFSPLYLKDMLFSAFMGIIAVLILYNLFIYFTIRENNYLMYVGYIFFIGLAQLALDGYAFRLLWPGSPDFANRIIIALPSIAAIFATLFFKDFLQTETYFPFFKKVAIVSIFAFLTSATLSLSGFERYAYQLFNIYASTWPWVVLYAAWRAARKGYRPAKIIFAGWLLANIGFTIYALKNMGLLPFNYFTNYTMVAGIVVEAVVFSIALADKINFLKKENYLKQQEIIRQLIKNEEYLQKSRELELNTEKLKKEILSSKYESLKNQVNPHFLFNSLNVLAELVDRNQKQAGEFLQELSVIYRYILQNKNEEVVNLQTEMNFIESFTYLLTIRYGESLTVQTEARSEENYLIPPLTLQLLVENCIKHNIVSRKNPLHIRICFEGDYLVVSNNLQLKHNVTGSKTGIKNIMERYKYLTDRPVLIEKSENRFTVKVPLLFSAN